MEVSGDRVDNKSKLEIIKQEEEMIQQEKAELEKLHREAELKKAKALESKARIEAAAAQKEVLHFSVVAIDLLQFVVDSLINS